MPDHRHPPPHPLDPDRTVPALLVKVGHYPEHPGGLGVIRTLGRLGVPVYAMVEHPRTPAAVSRYLTRGFVLPSTGLEDPAELVERIRAAGRVIGRPAVAVATDDEGAVLLAEHAEALADRFLLPPVPPALPRELASKAGLYRLCIRHGVPTPRALAPGSRDELLATARHWGYPVVLKNLEAWTRLRHPVVRHTTVVPDEAALRALLPADGRPSVLLQEYLPKERCEDWISHLWIGSDGGAGSAPDTVFTGRKVRSWPPYSGVTTRARAVPNPELAALALGFCRAIGYRGVADLDWRRDLRDGRYLLVDFNPRTGAQFRAFESVDGVDVVRALHLGLTGRPVPPGPQLERGFAVGQLDLPSALVSAWHDRRIPPDLRPRRGTERSWLARDDPAPAAAEVLWFGAAVGRRLRRALG
ncbi:hypothetical protein ATKI12_7569 [Kitasatospora sp. Ki12]